ncbi:tape measure protein [Halopseudomonas pachastrellae]|nr:tape measure protein [Halopseudomonas pachastrellae]
MTRAFAKLGGVLATAFSVREVARAAETYTNINNRLKLVTSGTEELARAQRDLFNIAQSSRQPLSETAELYQRIAQNQDELGLTAAGVARIVETINKSLALSGTSAASAAGALTQLGQAFASGQLRGEELNSVLENAPALAQALAKGMGVTVGQLRALGQEGKLTAQNVVDALESQSAAMDDAFATLAPTMSSAMTTVSNAFTQLVGKMDETSGASSGVASKLLELGRVLQEPRTIEAAQNLAEALGTVVGWAIDGAVAFSDFGVAIGEWAGRLASGPADAVERMNLELEQSEQRLKFLADELSRPRLLRTNPFVSSDELEKEYNEVYSRIKSLEALKEKMSESPIDLGLPDIGDELDSILNRLGGFDAVLRKPSSVVASTVQSAKELNASSRRSLRREESSPNKSKSASTSCASLASCARRMTPSSTLNTPKRLRQYEKAGNQAMVERLETLRQIRALQIAADQAPGTVEGVSRAPDSQGADALYGGASGELAKLDEERARLDEWRATELELQRGFLEAKAINEEQYAERVRNIHEQHQAEMDDIDAARQQVALASAEDMFGSMADMARQFAGENSAIYKAMFAAEKAMAIARSVMAIQTGIAMAAANPFPANLAAMAMVAANTASIIGNISSIGLAGQAHDGIDSIPREGTWLLDKGERVVDRRTNADLKDFLAAGGARPGGGGQSTTVNLIEDASKAGQTQTRQMDGKQVIDLFVANIMQDGQASKALKQRFGLRNAAS